MPNVQQCLRFHVAILLAVCLVGMEPTDGFCWSNMQKKPIASSRYGLATTTNRNHRPLLVGFLGEVCFRPVWMGSYDGTILSTEDDNNTDHDNTEDDETTITFGTVLRTAHRSYQDDGNSKPSGRDYTTRKDERSDGIVVTQQGIAEDYNHYRTVALKGTRDRAVSLWTTDILEWLQQYSYYKDIRLGDFGENVSIEGVNYTYFEVGEHYQFTSLEDNRDTNKTKKKGGVILEITERMEPCANLCKLPYINNPELKPMERIQKCQQLLTVLDKEDGLRGWYAKVIQEGTIRPRDKVFKISKLEY